MAKIQIQPKSAKRTKGLGRPDTVGEPSSVRIMKATAAAVGTPWLWTLTYGHHDDRTPTHRLSGDARWQHSSKVERRK
jgi:hypothetical protein